MGRPATREPDYPCSVRLKPGEFTRAQALAKQLDLDLSKLLRRALQEMLQKYDTASDQ